MSDPSDREREKLLKELVRTHLFGCGCGLCGEYWRLVRANQARLLFENTRIIRNDDDR